MDAAELTGCWNCSFFYFVTLERCPNCEKANANKNMGVAMRELEEQSVQQARAALGGGQP